MDHPGTSRQRCDCSLPKNNPLLDSNVENVLTLHWRSNCRMIALLYLCDFLNNVLIIMQKANTLIRSIQTEDSIQVVVYNRSQVGLQLLLALVLRQLQTIETCMPFRIWVHFVELSRFYQKFGVVSSVTFQFSILEQSYLNPWMGVLEDPVLNLSKLASCV